MLTSGAAELRFHHVGRHLNRYTSHHQVAVQIGDTEGSCSITNFAGGAGDDLDRLPGKQDSGPGATGRKKWTKKRKLTVCAILTLLLLVVIGLLIAARKHCGVVRG